ncbi:unnamed protein product [Pedinophyceae sp. YPF-701]|nr:unnamed protein product [Pedinophyceae sp. YPF-701]
MRALTAALGAGRELSVLASAQSAGLARLFAAMPLREERDESEEAARARRLAEWDKGREGGARQLEQRSTTASVPKERANLAGNPTHWRSLVAIARDRYGAAMERDQVLQDSFGRQHTYLRISLTEKCNLRCTYCMPPEGVDLTPKPQLMSTDEVVRVASLFAEGGVSKVRLTGGEPTLRKDLVDIVSRTAALPGIEDVGITTNGIVLGRNLDQLVDAGMTSVNISLDTLQPDRFARLTRRKGLERVLDVARRAAAMKGRPRATGAPGLRQVKLNVVVMRGTNDDELGAFVDLTRDADINVRFIEWMPFDGNAWDHGKMMPYRDMVAAVEAHTGATLRRERDPYGEVAKNFRLPGHRGSVSFVTSMTEHFCHECTRLRVMADGNLKVCLFGHNEVSLRDAMREGATDDDLRYVLSAAVDRKRARHAGMFEIARQSANGRAMVKIGG